MKVRRLVGWVVLLVGLGVLAYGAWPYLQRWLASRTSDVRPAKGASLLLVTLDTTRADHLGCYGGRDGVTPVLDGLARMGLVFEDVTATAPITLPSHASMLTGLYPLHHGIRNNGMFTLPEGVQTLAQVLGGRGYATAAFVSAAVLTSTYGLDRGFEVYDDDLSQGRSLGGFTVPERRGDVTVAAALKWLASLSDHQRFFCWVHLYDPHAPYDPPPELRHRFPGDPYTAEIAFADSMVGRLLEWLDASGRRANTLVSVTADHGEALGEHGEQTHAILLHRATLHVPWILAGPNIPSGRRIAAPVSGADVAPTLAGLVGAPAPDGGESDGRSAVPLLEGRTIQPGRPLVSETLLPRYQYGWAPLYAVREHAWEIVSGRRTELFNLERDPRELADVSASEPTVLDELREVLKTSVEQGAERQSDNARLELSRSEMERLQALGYLGTDVPPRPDPPDPRDLIDAHVHMERARSFSARGNLDEATAELDRMLAEDPGNVSGLTMEAQILMQQQRFNKARSELERCLAIDPDNSSAYAIMTRLELARGNPERALELARMGAGKRGAFETLTVLQAQALSALDRDDEAAALLDERLEAHPDNADLLAARARFLVRDGRRPEAETLLRRAVAADALHSASTFALADLLEQEGRDDEANEVLERLLRIDPGNVAVLAALGRIRLDDPERARPYLEEAVRLNPSRFEPLVSLAVCYLRLDVPDRAEASLRRALAMRPDDPRTRNNLAIALFMEDRLDEAEKELRQILDRRPDFAEAHNNLALTLQRLGRIEEAEAEARESLRLLPEQRDGRMTLATILHAEDRYAEEVAVLEPLAGSVESDAQLAARYGVALEAAGRYQDAAPVLEAALAAAPQEIGLLLPAARCAEASGDSAKAIRLYERAAQSAPPGAARSEALSAIERLAKTIR